MFFNIDADNGNVVSGWFAPDNPAAVPQIAILIPGRNEIRIEATIQRNDVRDLGIHNTGQVGFRIDKAIVPDIASVADLELVEAETRLPIYRRFQSEHHLEQKLFLFDSSLIPQRRVQANIRRHFSLNYFSSERYSLETMIVLINNHMAKSVFVTGRSNYSRYLGYLEKARYLRAAILRDPFDELAERLLFLNLLSKSDELQIASNFVTGVTPLLDMARDLPFNDPKALLTRFRNLTVEQSQALANPMTRMFGCDVEALPERKHVSVALDNLAGMDVVGYRARYDAFRAILAQTVGADILGDEQPTEFVSVRAFAETLSRISIVVDLLEHDLALYSYAQEAIDVGIEGRDKEGLRDTQSM
jgi:hypothetical protein